MYFTEKNGALVARQQNETVLIEAWGTNALRVRATEYPEFSPRDWALSDTKPGKGKVEIADGSASIQNGKIKATVNPAGIITFYRGEEKVLREYFRNYGPALTRESRCLKVIAREFTPIVGGDYHATLRFESDDREKIFGMGQYQHAYLNQKGCILELAQRNSQVSIPFALSSLGYGFLWNNPATGRVAFGKNHTEWYAESTKQLDYWITADDSPAKIVENFTEVAGRAGEMPDYLLGLWQCKLRYRTQAEVLEVAREYKRRGIKVDVMVIDFFHWPRQGDWCFDKEYWPDPKAMVDELHAQGIKVMVSVWPSVDRKSSNFNEMSSRGYLIRTERGTIQTYDFMGDCIEWDTTNPDARAYVWEQCKKNYSSYGIDYFWLDNGEPDLAVYDYDNYRYYLGPHVQVGNVYPMLYAKTFFDGQTATKKEPVVSLVRSGWVGSQKYGTLLWSGDVPSTFEAFRDQIAGGLNAGLAGIPWWTSDIGGFMDGNVKDPAFVQLLLRWFQFAVFCPILRMHGDRDPHDIPPLSNKDFGGGFLYTGQPNELWTYGEEAFKIMKAQLELRESLKPYIKKLFKEAQKTGAPLLRPLFYEFPADEKAWEISDQYFFGPDYLVAPILQPDQFSRKVYLPAGKWEDVRDGKVYEGPRTIDAEAPIEGIPAYKRS